MNIIASGCIPAQALKKLSVTGNLIVFKTRNITYKTISCHPDIFFCTAGNHIIVAPNLPENIAVQLKESEISMLTGEFPIGDKYPESSRYNAVVTESFIIHNFRYTDPVITGIAQDRELIHVNQGYTRCNLLPLKNDHFITSDEGIYRILTGYGLNVLFVGSKDIILPGMNHGFFGGACGICEDKVYIIGSLNMFAEGEKVRKYLQALTYEIVELYEGPLFDGGSLLFL